MSSFAEPTADASAAAAQGSSTGWITFSGVMLIVAGFLNLVDGLWALDPGSSPAIASPTPALIHVIVAGVVVFGLSADEWPERSEAEGDW